MAKAVVRFFILRIDLRGVAGKKPAKMQEVRFDSRCGTNICSKSASSGTKVLVFPDTHITGNPTVLFVGKTCII